MSKPVCWPVVGSGIPTGRCPRRRRPRGSRALVCGPCRSSPGIRPGVGIVAGGGRLAVALHDCLPAAAARVGRSGLPWGTTSQRLRRGGDCRASPCRRHPEPWRRAERAARPPGVPRLPPRYSKARTALIGTPPNGGRKPSSTRATTTSAPRARPQISPFEIGRGPRRGGHERRPATPTIPVARRAVQVSGDSGQVVARPAPEASAHCAREISRRVGVANLLVDRR